MNSAFDIQVHTVYSADEHSAASSFRLRLMAVLTLAAGLAWLYATWQPMYQWIERSLVFGELNIYTSVMNQDGKPSGELRSLAQLMNPPQPGASPASSPTPAPGRGGRAGAPATPSPTMPAASEKQAEMQQAQTVLGVTAGGWLATTTLVGLLLVMSGASGVSGSRAARRLGALFLPLSLAAVGAVVWYVWKEYEWYSSITPPWALPSVLGLVAAFAASLGAILHRRTIGLHRLSGLLVVVSAAVSVAAIWVAVRWGQMPADQINMALYGKVFGFQSAYGWVLLLGTIGLK